MIRVELHKDDRDVIRTFRVEGHSGYADHGQDIICAGVSAITQTALIGLLHHLEQKPVYRRGNGMLVCSLGADLNESDALKARIILSTMELGLKDIQSQFQDFMQIRIRRC